LKQRKFFIRTFGCQMNVHDSEQMAELLKGLGYIQTDSVRQADLIIVNTCSIREKAAQKVYSQLGRYRELKKRKPGIILGISGCLAQQMGPELFERMPYLDMVLGTHNIHRLPEMLRTAEERGVQQSEIEFHENTPSLGIVTLPAKGSMSAFVTVMQGCSNFCSFCVVPYVRGREESRELQDILTEIRTLSEYGIKEVTLLGQNVNSYGNTFGNGHNFAKLLRAVNEIEGIERIRFTTSHPKDLTGDIINCFGELGLLCGHIHLPVQSGSNRVLSMMNRKYTREDYLDKVARLRAACPAISITSDVIVGFPGETEEDYRQTIELMEEVRFDGLFSFKYSKRPGTAAAEMEDGTNQSEKDRRLRELQLLQERHTLEKHHALVGRREEVLVDGISRNDSGDLTGRTRSNKIVNFRGRRELIGKSVHVTISGAYLHSLRGEWIEC
jgi:tRNA-2-methylthio-N6-dimethylallyladenosine synthase